MALIDEQLLAVRHDVTHIGKNGKHPNYKFRSIEDVLNTISPVLKKYEITTSMNCYDIQSSTAIEDKYNTQGVKCGTRIVYHAACRVAVTMFAKDGSSREYSGFGEAVDYNDGRAANKAMSAGWKYAVALGLSIPFEGIDDNETTAAEPTKSTATTTPDSEVDPRTDALEVPLADPCLPHQRETIIRYWQLTNRTVEQLKEFLKGRGVDKLASLTVEQASKLTEALANKLRAESIPF